MCKTTKVIVLAHIFFPSSKEDVQTFAKAVDMPCIPEPGWVIRISVGNNGVFVLTVTKCSWSELEGRDTDGVVIDTEKELVKGKWHRIFVGDPDWEEWEMSEAETSVLPTEPS